MKHQLLKDNRWMAVLLLVVCFCTACEKRTLIHSYQAFPETGWAKGDTVEFQIPLTDSFLLADVYVELRHHPQYPYRNLPFAVRIVTPDSLFLPTDSVDLMLADSMYNWQGKGIGPLRQMAVRAGSVEVSHPGLYRIQMWHLLPDSLLPELNDIGIRLKRRGV